MAPVMTYNIEESTGDPWFRDLTALLQTRDVIGQAKGMIMARERVDAEEAFDILRRASQRTNRKLREIAAEVVKTFGDPGAPG